MSSRDQEKLLVSLSKLDFEQARIKHVVFKSKLRALLYGVEIDSNPVLSHEACSLGRWIYEIAMPRIGYMPEVKELERVHSRLHTIAIRLWNEYKNGHQDEAHQGLAEIEEVAQELLQLLELIEQKALA